MMFLLNVMCVLIKLIIVFRDMNTVRYIPGTENSKHLEVKEVNKEKQNLK